MNPGLPPPATASSTNCTVVWVVTLVLAPQGLTGPRGGLPEGPGTLGPPGTRSHRQAAPGSTDTKLRHQAGAQGSHQNVGAPGRAGGRAAREDGGGARPAHLRPWQCFCCHLESSRFRSPQQYRRWQVPQQKVKAGQLNPGCQEPFSSRYPRQLVPASTGRAGSRLPGCFSGCL